MSRKTLFVLVTIAATVAAFFVVVPFAQHYAAQQLGWNQSGQDALAKFLFFPILFVFLYVLKRLGAQRQDRPPGSE